MRFPQKERGKTFPQDKGTVQEEKKKKRKLEGETYRWTQTALRGEDPDFLSIQGGTGEGGQGWQQRGGKKNGVEGRKGGAIKKWSHGGFQVGGLLQQKKSLCCNGGGTKQPVSGNPGY